MCICNVSGPVTVAYSDSSLYKMYMSIAELTVVAPAITIIAISNVVIVCCPLLYVVLDPTQTVCSLRLV